MVYYETIENNSHKNDNNNVKLTQSLSDCNIFYLLISVIKNNVIVSYGI